MFATQPMRLAQSLRGQGARVSPYPREVFSLRLHNTITQTYKAMGLR